MGEFDNKEREEVFSKKVRAGKRTYFFDVKATRSGDYYLTLTESKKRLEDGVFVKHKIFLYKEDFEKFSEALGEAFKKIIELNKEQSNELEIKLSSQFTDISFDELGDNGQQVRAAE